MPELGCINVHGSILPKYRGAAPIQWCLYHGEKETGITTMLMNAGMDTGAMVLKAYTQIHLLDNSQDLAQKLAQMGADLLIDTLTGLERQEIQPIPQDDAQATYAPLIKKPDYAIDWSKSAIALHNQVRGFFPNCVATFRSQPLKIVTTAPLDADLEQLPPDLRAVAHDVADLSSKSFHPGEVANIIKGYGPALQTGKGLLLLQEVQQAGKRPQSGWDFVNGNRVAVGEILAKG
jgi:methionyl-tRNA formyltransferase